MNTDYSAVELKNVTKQFTEFMAVKNTSLAIRQGEFFSMLGPSGCGKTTTLRMIAGFEHPTSGIIRLLGQDIQDQPPHRRNVNMVFQNYALFPHLTVFDNVAFGLEVKRVSRSEIRQRVTQALEMVRLPNLERRRPGQLSGGQQQRVALARALVNHPAVLLLDEPLGALDLKLRKEMQLELKRLQREVGITFIYVTHDQEEALTMSDRIAVMHQGEVLQVDQPTVIYERPVTRFVADFIGVTNFLEGRLVSQSGAVSLIEIEGLGQIHANAIAGAVSGQAVTLAVRPERMELRTVPVASSDNQVQGTIVEVVFVGNDTQYFVQLSNGIRIMVRQQNRMPLADTPPIVPSQEVTVHWSAASTNVLTQ
jgi:spermidine/putrescine transport system ATP-binding protein